jgi:MOSC domain-containing protein YiiM
MTAGVVHSVNTSRGGVPKMPAFEARVGTLGLEGDHQNDSRHHGGPDRAVVLYSLDLIARLQREGHPIRVGTTGENLTISGIEWGSLVPGSELSIGEIRLQITKYVTPCRNIRHSFKDGDFMRISQERHPGWSRLAARVLSAGTVRPGDSVRVGTP